MSIHPIAFSPHNTNGVHLTLHIADPEVVHELDRHAAGPARDEFARQALRIGVLALRQASGALDADAIRREGESIVRSVHDVLLERTTSLTEGLARSLAQYFDPTSGALPQRLEQLTKRDGTLEQLLARHLDGDRSTLAKTMAQHVGEQSPLLKVLSPTQSEGLLAVLTRSMQQALDAQREEVVKQFSLDREESALSRLVSEVATHNGKLRTELQGDVAQVVKEFSLDNTDGALSRLVTRVEKAQSTIVEQLSLDHDGSALQRLSSMLEKTSGAVENSLTLDVETSPLARLRRELSLTLEQIAESNGKFHAEVKSTLEGLRTKREAAARTPVHGNTFEEAAGEFLRADAQRAGDVFEAVGTRNGRDARKVGDHVVTLSPESAGAGARIACEAKANKTYTEAMALAELAEARTNRAAQIGIMVFERASAPEGIATLRRIGQDILVVWDAEDAGTDLSFATALSLARALAVRERLHDARSSADLRDIEIAIHAVSSQAETVEEIVKLARGITKKGSQLLVSAEAVRDGLARQVAALQKHVAGLRTELSS